MLNQSVFTSRTSEWYTPQPIVRRVVDVLGEIDLDPCSNSRTAPSVPARRIYTADDDGLAQPWSGRVYMNPPYGREIRRWVERLCDSFEAGEVSAAIALLPSRTDTAWFARLRRYPRCFLQGRLRFEGAANPAPFPSMAVYLGNDVARFAEVFGAVGHIYVAMPV